MDRLEVLLAGHDEGVGPELLELVERHADLLAYAVLDEARAAVGAFDDRVLVGALHQLEDLRAHRLFDDAQQDRSTYLAIAVLGAADPERADAALVVGRDRHGFEDALDLVVGEAVVVQAVARCGHDHLLRARARRHTLRGHPYEAARAAFGRHGRAVERVDLLRRHAADRCRLVLGIARLDVHLGAQRLLALADQLGDVRGQRLGLEGFVQDDLLDRLVDRLLEARHVRALLRRAEVDEALERGVEELRLVARGTDSDDLLHAGYPNARKTQMGGRATRLDVFEDRCSRCTHKPEDTHWKGNSLAA